MIIYVKLFINLKMNLTSSDEENFKITDNYNLIIKQVSEDFIKYISNFKVYSYEYIKKISENNEKFNKNNSAKIHKELCYDKIDLNHIIQISSIIPSIIEQQIRNFDFFIKEIDGKIEKFQKLYNEKSSKYLILLNNYKEIKNEFNKNCNEIEKFKLNYISNIASVEEMVHKFYVKKIFNKKKLNNISIPSSKENNKDQNNNLFLITLDEQLNNNIQKVKKIELDYMLNFALVKSVERKYIKITNDSKTNIRKLLCEILNGFKDLLIDCMIYLKNCYKFPLSEIDTFMNEIINIDECDNFDNIIISSYRSEKNPNIILQKYKLKFFQNNNNFNENEEEIKLEIGDSTSLVKEEGFQEIDFLHEKEIFFTIKIMMDNFELLDNNSIDLTLEEEKLHCKFLTLKILSFNQKSKLYSGKIPPITNNEVNELEKMMDKKINRTIFIQKLSQFRNLGIFQIPEREYNIISKLFNKIIKNIDKNTDYDSMINIIILSQTYYAIKEGKKEYLQKEIMKNDIFKTKNFWETYVNFSIMKEISICPIGDNYEDEDIKDRYSNIVFSQIVPITNNMIDFGLDINIVESIIQPIIERYNISKELAGTVISVINEEKNKVNDKNKNEIILNDDINKEKINNIFQ